MSPASLFLLLSFQSLSLYCFICCAWSLLLHRLWFKRIVWLRLLPGAHLWSTSFAIHPLMKWHQLIQRLKCSLMCSRNTGQTPMHGTLLACAACFECACWEFACYETAVIPLMVTHTTSGVASVCWLEAWTQVRLTFKALHALAYAACFKCACYQIAIHLSGWKHTSWFRSWGVCWCAAQT